MIHCGSAPKQGDRPAVVSGVCMPKIRMLTPRIGTLDTRTARVPPKQADPYYLTPQHRAWARDVIDRAGGRCEAIDEATGERCTKAEPYHRMFADHVEERRDGGADLGQGKCMCGSHHTEKTTAARAARAAR